MSASKLRFQSFSYGFAEQVLDSRVVGDDIGGLLSESVPHAHSLSRPGFDKLLEERLILRGWARRPPVFDESHDPVAEMRFLKERVGIEKVGFARVWAAA